MAGTAALAACAREDRVARSGARANSAGCIAAWTMEDLKQDGVGHIPFPPMFKRADGSPMAAPLRTPLAEDKVYYVGQPVAAIVAQSREQAQDAAELALVEYEDLPCVMDAREAVAAGSAADLAAGAGQRRRRSAVSATRKRSKKRSPVLRMSRGYRAAQPAHRSRWRWSRAARSQCTRAAAPRSIRRTRRRPARASCSLRCSARKPEDYRVVIGDIGGGFGMKTGLAPEDALVCYAARKLGRPVKWRADRSEDFLAAHMGRDQHYERRAGARSRRPHPRACAWRCSPTSARCRWARRRSSRCCSRRRCRPPCITCPRWTIACTACSRIPWRPAPIAAPAAPRRTT